MLRYARPVMHTMHNTLCDAYSSVHNAALMAAPRIMRVHNAMHNAHQIAREIEMAREITVTRERCTRVRVALRGRARARARAHHDTVPLTRQDVVVRVFSSTCARTRHSKRRQPSHQPPRARCRTRTLAVAACAAQHSPQLSVAAALHSQELAIARSQSLHTADTAGLGCGSPELHGRRMSHARAERIIGRTP